MKNRIVEILEIGVLKSIIQREGVDVSELIDTYELIDELNLMLNKENIGTANENQDPCRMCRYKYSCPEEIFTRCIEDLKFEQYYK